MKHAVPDVRKRLFQAFEDDHAELGRRLYQLRQFIASKDNVPAKKLAGEILQTAGAHIAFEEHDFYPALRAHLSADEVSRMYAEHEQGLLFLEALSTRGPDSAQDTDTDLREIDALDHHVADCGRLFGAMGGLSSKAMADLMARLEAWRRLSPSWSDVRFIAHPYDQGVNDPKRKGD
jgi:hypothetical protein